VVDRLTTAQRSRNMAQIRGVNTTPERVLRCSLHREGFRFRLHRHDLPGRPDIVLRRYNAVIFVHGCFWHRHAGCAFATAPKTRPQFWADKLNANSERDRRQIRSLLQARWRVLIVWECALRREPEQIAAVRSSMAWLRSKRPFGQIPLKPRISQIGTRKPSAAVSYKSRNLGSI
jgi:DNA mismatch endonuclease, patch repair protein